ncbi:protein of unknown function DUF167 [Ammonifex degensii KC4]|uniref:UPF0235 protein Adeg_1019 n=1 Tax=Ammonifex degensii (strain DSM 10501 / KC4) TaxID=429009 RepID=C9RD25_AMMDK|nr:DUF167 domain-containing protein [Ammonifex degensii]ACX52152.1 protein of unknown function DUF167 [Ammonifex degensii KC4]
MSNAVWQEALREGAGGKTFIHLRVTPRSSTLALEAGEGFLRVRLTAPPVEGKANELLLEFLSRVLDIPARRLQLVKGLKGREKVVLVDMPLPLVAEKIEKALS